MTIGLVAVMVIAIFGAAYAAFNYVKVKALDEGTPEMSEIASAIRTGANTFLRNEYMVLSVAIVALTLVFGFFIAWPCAISFLIGVAMSGLAGLIGMKMATLANVRVTNTARLTRKIHDTLKVALRGGSVMGLLVSACALFGLTIVFLVYKDQIGSGSITNWAGISFVPFSMIITSYSLGCSIVAMFNRVGGGIYTKAADMGADLVGKTELNLPEDSPQNPAVIADCVGDNVGDTAGLGSDLLESYMGAIVSAIVLTLHLFQSHMAKGLNFSEALCEKMYMYPIYFCAIGLLACIAGLAFVFKKSNGENPHKELNKATWISAGATALFTLILTIVMFANVDLGDIPFKLGIFSPWVSACFGIISGVILGRIAEYYTSDEFKPTKELANMSEEGPAITITQGLAVGMRSTLFASVAIGIALLFAYVIAGVYGVAIAAVGMLSFVSVTVSVDTYGPISDNAGGIAEMTGLPGEVRSITDSLDSVGNTTAAIGKGFAIGSAAFATVSLMISFLYSFNPIDKDVVFDVLNPFTLAGLIIGGAITYYFSGLLTQAVSKSARKMVDEVRRQFKEIPGLKEGTAKPDYKSCIGIATKGALGEMKKPALIAILVPIVSGFLFGPQFVAGILLGTTLAAILLAIFTGNSGGAWDNSKKYIEAHKGKGTEAHIAAVIGDTVGDPLKDTVGPSLDIQIKIMSTVSIIMVCFFSKFNLVSIILSWLGLG